MKGEWAPIEIRAEEVAEAGAAGLDAVHAVATSAAPAAIVRGACSENECRELLSRLFERKLFVGYEEHGRNLTGKSPVERFDIGTSLGNFGGNSDEFFARARETNALYEDLFDGVLNPVELLYGYLTRLSNGKQVNIAHEPDGRLYGPAIFRCHMPRWGYPPHVDSVRNRELRVDFAVHRFAYQLGGILLLQSPEEEKGYRDSVLYKCPWTQEVAGMMEIHYLGLDEPEAAMLNTRRFEEYVKSRSMPQYEMRLAPGDLYFFRADQAAPHPGLRRYSAAHHPRDLHRLLARRPPRIMVWS